MNRQSYKSTGSVRKPDFISHYLNHHIPIICMANIFRPFFFRSLFFFWYRFLLKQLKNLIGSPKNISNTFGTQFKYQKFPSLAHRSDLNDYTLILDVEGTLLRSPSLFPYFVLVAFEAGDLFRAIFLLVSYPLVCMVGHRMGIQIMVMISFFGIKAESFRAGRAVLPKFLLDNVGSDIIEVLSRGGGKVGVTNLPQVMVESFLREYLKVDFVVGTELKVFCGYYVGLMEPRNSEHARENLVQEIACSDAIGITTFNKILDHHDLFSQCKEIYLVTEADKRGWQKLGRDQYPGALIFHDSRLAVAPTPLDGVAILMWLPYSIILAIFRIIVSLSLPYSISTPLLTFTGLRLTVTLPKNSSQISTKGDGRLYVCNHRTLLDPLYLSFALKKDLIAVTYSLSRLSEILAPIKTVRLTRNRYQDANMMRELVKQGDVAVCPEGTTCREPYLLRFSPLFSEICDKITPVAINSHVSMFHGTTAGGFKWLDPIFFLMNPSPFYSVKFLHQVSPSSFASGGDHEDTKFQVANHVQSQIGKALGFECTKLTRKDKYLLLAGNEGLVSNRTSSR